MQRDELATQVSAKENILVVVDDVKDCPKDWSHNAKVIPASQVGNSIICTGTLMFRSAPTASNAFAGPNINGCQMGIKLGDELTSDYSIVEQLDTRQYKISVYDERDPRHAKVHAELNQLLKRACEGEILIKADGTVQSIIKATVYGREYFATEMIVDLDKKEIMLDGKTETITPLHTPYKPL